jgi:hypothetical protein
VVTRKEVWQNSNMASCLAPQQVQIKEAQASGANSTAFSAPTVIQYPRPPRNDSSKYVAIGSIMGTLLGRLANSGRLNEASSAEDTWKGLNGQLKDRGIGNWTRSDEDRTASNTQYGKVDARADILVTRADEEDARADVLSTCLDSLHQKLCAYAECGYKPDYDGILTRVKVDAAAVAQEKIKQVCYTANRYNTGINADVACEIQKTAVLATVGTAAKLREDERQFMWKFKGDLYAKTAQTFESHRNGRLQNELQFTDRALQSYRAVAEQRGQRSLQWDSQGGQMVSSAGQNYAWLAESLRRTAQLDSGDFAALGVGLALLLPSFFKDCNYATPDDCGCAAAPAPSPAPSPAIST